MVENYNTPTIANTLYLADQIIMQLIAGDSTYDKIESLEEMVVFLDAKLAIYENKMKLRYFDDETKTVYEFDNYLEARKHVGQKIANARHFREDKLTRGRFVNALLVYYRLLRSVDSYIGIIPPIGKQDDDSTMEAPRVVQRPIIRKPIEKPIEKPVRPAQEEEVINYGEDEENDTYEYEK